MIVKIKNLSNNELPSYQTEGAAGVDLHANLPDSNITLQPLERTLVPTGLFLEIPEGYEAQVRPRSGMAIKHGITVINSPGTIDCDYRGEVKVPIVNLSNEPFTITHGDRIAQWYLLHTQKPLFKQLPNFPIPKEELEALEAQEEISKLAALEISELKYELQTIICGTGKVSYGDTIQAATRYLRRSKSSSGMAEEKKSVKNKETARLIK